MGLGARQAYARVRRTRGRSGRLAASGARGTAPKAPGRVGGRWHELVDKWARRFGPAALLLSWLPVVGDPLCAVAGWLRLSFWPSVLFMAIGKFFRYLVMTGLLMWVFPVGS
jgi:membrane protein YqaA with SNARE-associated domain